MRLGMMIDLNRCVGCYGCVIKCKQEHFLPPDIMWGRLLMTEMGTYPNATKLIYPVLCNHCQDPMCVKACPTGATQQRPDGIVWVDADKCVGCRYCIIACPYQVRTYYAEEKEFFLGQGFTELEQMRKKLYPLQKKTVVKCNFCMERIESGTKNGLKPGVDWDATPMCVNICPAKARYFGDLDDPDSEVSAKIREKKAAPLHPEYGTEPSVYYAPR